jgi:RNA polymerase sigma-70 factor (ECF subfamily)
VRDAANDEAWRTFVDIYAPLVYGFARRQGLQDADAADVSQEVMVEVARSIRAFEYQPERGRFRDWLLRVTRRRLFRFFGRQARRVEASGAQDAEDEAALAAPDPEWAESFNQRILETAMQRIRPHFESSTWRAFESVWLENRPAGEAADELSMRVHSVYVAKSRVLKRLEEEVRDIVEEFSWLDALGSLKPALGADGEPRVVPGRDGKRQS